jgi:hypothetical protein
MITVRIVLLYILVGVMLVLWWDLDAIHKSNAQPPHYHNAFDITRGYIIALRPSSAKLLLDTARHFLSIPDMSVFHGVNGSQALETGNLSLYTQYLMISGSPTACFVD